MQSSHGDWKTWKMKIVTEKCWKMLLSVIDFYQFCPWFFANINKFSIRLESPEWETVREK